VGIIRAPARENLREFAVYPGDFMSYRPIFNAGLRLRLFLKKPVLTLAFVAASGLAVEAQHVPLTAIELYDGPTGAAFVQVTELLINGKAEVRSCAGAERINKSTYGKLPKILLNSSVTSLERDASGIMNLTRDAAAECVLPSNLKFEKDESLTPAQLADRAVLQGRVLSSFPAATTEVPPFKPGVKIVFVTVPDTEFAEYLRAVRAHSVAQWEDYLGHYPKAAHSDAAKQALAAILLKEGEDALASYRTTTSTNAPAYPDLRTAYLRADRVHDLQPASEDASKLRDNIRAELALITGKGSAELQAYKQALAGHASGYVHLANAQQFADHALEVDPHFDQALTLQSTIAAERRRIDTALRGAESLIAVQRYDDAVTAVAEFRAFSDAEPRLAAVVDAAYKYHFERGKANAASQKWHDAVQEFQKASELKPTPEAAAALKQAQADFQSSINQAAATAALQQSSAFEQDKNYIEAYEVLANLPEAQRALAQNQMQALEASYLKSASDEANKLQSAHSPIQGVADEIAMQKAHDYLQRASTLQPDDQNLKFRIEVISQTLSGYYIAQAKRFLDKPLGSGVGLAWLYLNEAQQYQPDRVDVRDERTRASAIHNIRSTLSIKVVFRDQTSRRDSSGFADQLSDAIATGLETTTLPVRIIRGADATPVEPNFQLIGDVIEHRPVAKPTVESMDSEYRAAERELPNDDWNKANRDYEAANLDLQKAQKVLEGAQAHGKKKEIASATTDVEDAQKKVEEAHRKLDSISKTILVDVLKPYSYTRRTIDLSAVVDLGFRIVDPNGNTIASTPSLKSTAQKQFVVLENVKPEDTKNVKQIGAPPDEAQFLGDVEIAARTALIKDVKEKVESLPGKILAQARQRLADGDTEGAAESYILYLNSTPDIQTPEREEAKKFLRERFNMVWGGQFGLIG
jgi:tetratricopeptide (TPR) repeat protein